MISLILRILFALLIIIIAWWVIQIIFAVVMLHVM
jgi:hypothetical protein